ncbi:MAG: PorV/PorQ family protein [Candidatus Marinimicrobia bacterium]|nr:PorV/PorQ family protein [Candidatus Neomarinimicrobiota bacterium]
MRKTTFTLTLLAFAVFLILPSGSYGQSGLNWGEGFDQGLYEPGTKYAQAGMTFLSIDPGARTAALGGTKIGAVGSAENMFGNPATLAMVQGVDVFFSQTNWIVDIGLMGIGAAFNAGNLGVFGVNFVSTDYGDIPRTYPYSGFDPNLRSVGYIQEGTFTVEEYAVGVSYAKQVISQFYVGGNVKYAYQNLGDVLVIDRFTGDEVMSENDVTNVVFDLGTLYYPGYKDLRFGVAFRNFSNQSDFYDARFELPLTFDFGIAMDLLKIFQENSNNQLTLAVDAVHPRDWDERVHVGVEYDYMGMLFLRGGYKFNYSEEGLTAGLGVDYEIGGVGIKADYAYSPFGIFENVNRFSIGLAF